MARKSFPLRISPELYAALERWAADEMRSVNAQIEFLLSQSVKKAGRARLVTAQQHNAAPYQDTAQPQDASEDAQGG